MSQEIKRLVHRINQAWQTGRPEDIERVLHPDVVMVFPGFGERAKGAKALIAGFTDFCANAKVLEYDESNLEVDVIDRTAVATFSFSMVYEREGRRYESSGRDLWMFAMEGDEWKATWRTMLDTQEREV